MNNQPTEDEWLDLLRPFDPWNRRALLGILALFGIPPTLLDIGSGTGAMVQFARSMGVDAVGVDQIAQKPDYRTDLATPLDLARQFAYVLCLETAEHIPEMYAETFVANIAHHVIEGGLLIFSAASPGQAGNGHVHLKGAEYWRTMFWGRKLLYREDMTIKLKLAWQLIPMPMMWLASNCQIFSKPTSQNDDG
jgi:SAM-dependent methyltransferase